MITIHVASFVKHNVLRQEARVLFVSLDSGSTQMALHYSDNSIYCYSEFVRHTSEATLLKIECYRNTFRGIWLNVPV